MDLFHVPYDRLDQRDFPEFVVAHHCSFPFKSGEVSNTPLWTAIVTNHNATGSAVVKYPTDPARPVEMSFSFAWPILDRSDSDTPDRPIQPPNRSVCFGAGMLSETVTLLRRSDPVKSSLHNTVIYVMEFEIIKLDPRQVVYSAARILQNVHGTYKYYV